MVLYPDVQAQAQAEIDAVIGDEKLPTIEDREKLPYVSALVMEVLRWHVVAPISGYHRVMEDDIHDGYFIPKGTIVFPNVWHVRPLPPPCLCSFLFRNCRKMLHDDNVYKSPSSFNPERFIKTEGGKPEPDPRDICFGFGRR